MVHFACTQSGSLIHRINALSFILTCLPLGQDSPKQPVLSKAERLNTTALYCSTFRWFRAIAYTTTLMDLPSSYLQHSTSLLPWLFLGTLCVVWDFETLHFQVTTNFI